MVLFRLLGRTTRIKEHGGVRDVSVSILEGFPLQGAYALLLVTALFIKRVNCNAFVEHLYRYHNFVQGKYQNINAIRKTIPAQFLPDFEHGLRS